MKPFLMLLAGPTCGGKSSIARAAQALLAPGACIVVALDWYYRDLSHVDPAERAAKNFDHPDAIDWPLLKVHVRELIAGRPILAPTYDFARHARGEAQIEIAGAPVLIVEGILALYDEDVDAMAGLRVFVDVPDKSCLDRRVKRDIAERGRSEESVRAQFQSTVLPMAEQFVRPSKRFADMVLDGQEPIDALARRLVERIDSLVAR